LSRKPHEPLAPQPSHTPLHAVLQQMFVPFGPLVQLPEMQSLAAEHALPSPTLGSRQFPEPSQLPRTPGATFSQRVPALAKRGRHSCWAVRQTPKEAQRLVVTSAG